MKVFVALKYKPFCDNEYVGVASSQKKALEILKKTFSIHEMFNLQ